MQVVADQEELEESFHLNVLDSDAGIQMADRILSSCAERLLQKRLFSAIILTGRGICTDGLGVRFYAADLQTAPCICGDGCIYPRGADPLGRSL